MKPGPLKSSMSKTIFYSRTLSWPPESITTPHFQPTLASARQPRNLTLHPAHRLSELACARETDEHNVGGSRTWWAHKSTQAMVNLPCPSSRGKTLRASCHFYDGIQTPEHGICVPSQGASADCSSLIAVHSALPGLRFLYSSFTKR